MNHEYLVFALTEAARRAGPWPNLIVCAGRRAARTLPMLVVSVVPWCFRGPRFWHCALPQIIANNKTGEAC